MGVKIKGAKARNVDIMGIYRYSYAKFYLNQIRGFDSVGVEFLAFP